MPEVGELLLLLRKADSILEGLKEPFVYTTQTLIYAGDKFYPEVREVRADIALILAEADAEAEATVE